MANENAKAILDGILAGLKSKDTTQQLAAIHELETISFSSEAIVLQLEQLALHGESAVQKIALEALTYKTNQFVASQLSTLSKPNRKLILAEIDEWLADGLMEAYHAEVLRRHYDFDMQPATQTAKAAEAPRAVSVELPAEQPQPATSALPPAPRPSLAQVLLSETSIRIYLYLGAFFVIASAAILAALVEAVRLPILLIATLAFAGGAVGFKKRLPQPSFAFAIVFSFLLPIDANVFKETLSLHGSILNVYWAFIFLSMALIWAFSTWFYASSFFSLVAFVSLSLAFYRAAEIFQANIELDLLFLMVAALAGLAGIFLLKKWQSQKFALPLFLLTQAQVLVLLLVSLSLATSYAVDSKLAHQGWFTITLTWISAAAFFAASDLLIPFFFFPWLAVGSLLFIPWFILNNAQPALSAYAIGFWLWGIVFAVVSEILFRFDKFRKYGWAFLTGSLPLFLTAIVLAFIWDHPNLTFIIIAGIALTCTALHVLRPRWYVWSAALLHALLAYFVFFTLPLISRLHVPFVYHLLTASVFLTVPELFLPLPLSSKNQSRLPALAIGLLVSTTCILSAVTDTQYTGRAAVVFLTFAFLLTLHAFHFKQARLGYLAATAEILTVLYALAYYDRDWWLPILTAMAVIYFVSGFILRRIVSEFKDWGHVLLNSGLVLGLSLSFTAFALEKETAGWYMLVVAVLFVVDMFARPLAWLEVIVEVLLSLALFRILTDRNASNLLEQVLFGGSLIWLGGDLIFGRLLTKRIHRPIVLGVGCVLVAVSTLMTFSADNLHLAITYYLIYAAFFILYAVFQREPRLGYFTTIFIFLALLEIIDLYNIERWAFPLIFLAALYYMFGFAFRWAQTFKGWDQTLLYSALTLGVLTSVGAASQNRLDSSIPIAIAATLFAIEAFTRRNVWWALPANSLYLVSYFVILYELHVDEPQYYSIGTAVLGMLMNYLLTRAGSRTGAFIMGMLSQLVLLGTTYIQMVAKLNLNFFVVLFIQSMVILAYGLFMRSRSLVIAPIFFVVLGVITILYYALRNLSLVLIIGLTGLALLALGILAVVMRERITTLAERFSDWNP